MSLFGFYRGSVDAVSGYLNTIQGDKFLSWVCVLGNKSTAIRKERHRQDKS